LLITISISVLMLVVIGLVGNFWLVVAAITILGLAESASRPIRQAFLNGMIPSQQRATILSFDSLIDNAGGIVAQPALGKSADVWGYPMSYVLSAAGTALALPFIARARSFNTPADSQTAPLQATQQTSSAKEVDT
jgi:MFS family permease